MVIVMFVIPIYIEAGITGFESPAAEYKELGLSLDELLIKHPSATFVGLASGASMQDVGIFDGDILIVDRALDINNGDVIVASFNGSFVCKIIDKTNQLLISASHNYAAVAVNQDDNFKIEGVVTCSIRLHKHTTELTKCMR